MNPDAVLAAAAAAWARIGAGLTPADRTALGEELARRRRAPGPAAHRAATERAAALLATGLPGEFGAGGRSVASRWPTPARLPGSPRTTWPYCCSTAAPWPGPS
ncbi:hypothetical protein [Streptomyces sp. B29(2018)]|uniref:hypothetical protein n=1 Tax=Streptomyces sp. B29(2018) TaxID=2485016 RepID=UPI001F0CB482|nr:hypothetical protein [Streptomyces sp. B29(2018)]